MNNFDDYKIEIKKVMKEVCEEHGLFCNSLQLNKSSGRNTHGYKIQIFEEEYPSSKNVPHENRKGVYDSISIALIKEINDENDANNGKLLISIRDSMRSLFDCPR